VDAVITDPPYGINTKSDGSGKLSPWGDLCNSAFWYAEWLRLCRGPLAAGKPAGCLWTCLNWRSLVTFQKAALRRLAWAIESLLVWDKKWIGPGGSRGLRPSPTSWSP
jgi:tRNA G10  N-methylase Trm11